MKAMVQTAYGLPEVLELQDTAKPSPKGDEVLIRIGASSIGPSDCAFRKGDPFVIRLMYGFKRPKNPIGGTELAGRIEEIGPNVKHFKVGDRVMGLSYKSFGAHAEYKCLSESFPLVAVPDGITDEEAAGVCDGGATALTFLRDVAKLRIGQKVLINGASGAVGIYAVQLAKYYGAEVTGVCSAANADLVSAMGADNVIDYTREDFTKMDANYDVIFDAVGKSSFPQCKRLLSQQGVYLTTVPKLSNVWHMAWTSCFGSRKAKFATAGLMQNKDNLALLLSLMEEGKIKAVIDRRYPLDQLADAHRYVDTERKKGNVIITFAKWDTSASLKRTEGDA